jgi:hypothetical protein
MHSPYHCQGTAKTSADIDSIAIHLFSISFYWARKENGKFKNKVYVLLQKQKPELYNITGIIELLEERFGLSWRFYRDLSHTF